MAGEADRLPSPRTPQQSTPTPTKSKQQQQQQQTPTDNDDNENNGLLSRRRQQEPQQQHVRRSLSMRNDDDDIDENNDRSLRRSRQRESSRSSSSRLLFSSTSSILAPPTAMGNATRQSSFDVVTQQTEEQQQSSKHSHALTGTLFGEVMRSVQKSQSSRFSLLSSNNSSNGSNPHKSDSVSLFPMDPPPATTPTQGTKRPRAPLQGEQEEVESEGRPSKQLYANNTSAATSTPTKETTSTTAAMADATTNNSQTPNAAEARPSSFSTPADKNDNHSQKAIFTPQGFQMLQFVNQAEDSPFNATTTPTKAEPQQQQQQQNQQAQTLKSRNKPRPEWYDLPSLQQPSASSLLFPVLDWSLKDQVSFEWKECDDEISKHVLLSCLHTNATIQQAAQQDFCGLSSQQVRSINDNNHTDDFALQNWAKSLLYWQYPASLDSDAATMTTQDESATSSKRLFSSSNHHNNHTSSHLLRRTNSINGSRSVVESEDHPQSRWSRSGFSSSTSSHLQSKTSASSAAPATRDDRSRRVAEQLLQWKKQQPSRHTAAEEWQDAFWSLYRQWKMAVHRLLQQEVQAKKSTIAADSPSATLENVLGTSFYACGRGHSVLFRVRATVQTTQRQTDNGDDGNETAFPWHEEEEDASASEDGDEQNHDDDGSPWGWELTPEVVFSSSSLETRQRLRSMGACLRFLDGPEDFMRELEFGDDEEAFWEHIEQQRAPTHTNDATTTAAKAAADSPSIQADLVALRREQATGKVVGADISVKTQTKKNPATKRRPRPQNLPPLVVSGVEDCASFAEFYLNTCGSLLNTEGKGSQQQFPLLLCRHHVGPFLHASMKQLRLTRRGTDGFRVRGLVLPCALREMTCNFFHLVRSKQGKEDSSERDPKLESFCKVHKGFDGVLSGGCLGGPSTYFFNNDTKRDDIDDAPRFLSFHYGDVLSVATLPLRGPAPERIKVERRPISF